MRRVHPLVANLAAAMVYAAVYALCYVFFLYPNFEYAGFTMHDRDMLFWVSSALISILPVFLYRGVRAVSSVISVFVYILLYVPIVLTFAFASERSQSGIVLVQLVFLAGMSMLFLADLPAIRPPLLLELRMDLMRVVLLLTVLGSLYVAFVYRSNLRLVSFGEAVYQLRAENEALGGGLITRYFTSWLSTVLVPLCLAYGLASQRLRFFAAGSAGCVLMYAATAAKAMIVLPVVFAGFYFLFARDRLERFFSIFAFSLALALAVLLAIAKPETATYVIGALLIHRSIGNGGQLTIAYDEFFSFFPQTDYSHVNPVRMVIGGYPYGDLGVGQVIGQHYFSLDMNANASFWATDGFAALGLPGVAVASAACAIIFVIMNTLTRGYRRLFVALCFLPFVMTMLNTSLFTALWSGGAVFLLLFFMLNRRDPVLLESR